MNNQMHRRSRKIEYLEEEYLLKQMGISKSQIPIYILKELLDNGIDADEDEQSFVKGKEGVIRIPPTHKQAQELNILINNSQLPTISMVGN